MLWTMVFILLRWQTFPGLTTAGWPWFVTVTDLYWWGPWRDRCTGPPCSTWTRPPLPVGYGPLMTNRWALPPPTPPSTLTCTRKWCLTGEIFSPTPNPYLPCCLQFIITCVLWWVLAWWPITALSYPLLHPSLKQKCPLIFLTCVVHYLPKG